MKENTSSSPSKPGGALEERIAHLSPAKRALLELRLKQKGPGAYRDLGIPRRMDQDRAPLSFVQERLWFLDQLEPDSIAYNRPAALRLLGTLDVGALEQSLQEIVRRHEVLRTRFETVDGTPVQAIAPALDVGLPVEDLGGVPEAEREDEARRLATEEARRPFDLERGPLARTRLLRLSQEEHVLLLTTHHIVFDGWSMEVFVQELGALYRAFSSGEPTPLSEPPIQYADYALWQRAWLKENALEEQLLYWRRQLADLSPLELPTDRPRPPVQTHRGASRELALPKELTEALKGLARGEGATLFMVLLAAFQALLCRYSDQEDVAVGTPIAGRNRSETEGLIGFFVNTLVMRCDLSGDPSFRELLSRVRRVALGAYDHQDVPFEKLVEELRPERDLSRTPLFQAYFNMQNVPVARIEASGLAIERLPSPDTEARFDLNLYARERDGEVHLELVYNADLFDGARISEMLQQLNRLLAQAVEDPRSTIGSYSLVTPRAGALLPDPEAAVPEPRYEPVTNAFLSWADRTPHQTAVRQGEQAWSYDELAASASALARHLRGQGIGGGDVVALLGPRSFGLIASMMAVLLSRGVFLTVDRNLPVSRQRLMLQEAGAKHVLLIGGRQPEDGWVEELPSLATTSVASDTGGVTEPQGITDPEATDLPEVAPDDPAYIFFTSGTTGIPKGILGCHKGLSHFLAWQRETFAVGPQDRCAQLTSLSFDALLRDVFLPLTSGATLCLPEEDDVLSADQVMPWLERERVSLLHTVPAVAQSWLGYLPAGISLRALRCVLFSGEPLSEALVCRWREAFPEAGAIVNLYGPTETTMTKCFFRVGSPRHVSSGIQPVGWSLPQTQALVLSKDGQLCGIGEPGEIIIRTPFRTLGYIGAGREVEERRFVRNPFRDEEGDLLYRTGDRGRYRTDGALEYLGRLDNQVKIRGVRVEPGEIEAVLSQHPAVRESAVVARDDVSGGAPAESRRLVAYVVHAREHAPSVSELRGYLKERLPEYMVPSAFVTLESLPLTPNGKVDRQSLPAPEVSPEGDFVAPRDALEERLAEIWSEVLGVERVGAHDDFFELGGHSLLATRVVSRVREVFSAELPLISLFEEPTVAGLAGRVRSARRGAQGSTAPPIVPALRDAKLPLSFSQQRMWLLDQLEPDTPTYNISNAVRLGGTLDVGALERSLNEIVRRHEALRTRFEVVDGEPVQVIDSSSDAELPVEDLGGLPEAEREDEALRLAREEARRPFDLGRGPLVRARLLRLGPEEHLLLLTIHHIVSDGWSMEVFIREFGALYGAFSRGEPSPLAELPIQYADYALWQRGWLKGEVLEGQLSYWRRRLADLAPLELPTDRPRPPVQTHRGARLFLELPGELAEALKGLARAEGATLFMVLLAAFQVLLSRYSGQEDVAVGTPIAGRNRSETEGLIGFFVNTLVMRCDLSGDPTFAEVLSRVREAALGAYDHQEVPFEKLVEELKPERDLSRVPLSQVMFALQNVPREAPELPGLAFEREKVESGTTKYDLTFFMYEEAGGLKGRLVYNADLFDEATIERMVRHLRTLLESVVADPGRRVSDLELLTEGERNQLLLEWSGTGTEYPRDRCAHRPFEEQARRTPDAVAMVSGDKHLTYRELNARSNQLARHLRKLGVGPEVLVGICVERSLEMVVGLLGVLKAGGAYVPLDPSYPKQRLSFILEDTQAPVLLTQERLVEGLPEHGAEVVRLDTHWSVIVQEPEENLNSGVTAEDLAYVMYTSGSTGRPKGVMIEHRTLSSYVTAAISSYEITASDRVLQFASLSFDTSIEEILPCLASGGTLVLRSERMIDSMQRFVRECEDRMLSVLSLPTAFWHELVLAFEKEKLTLPPSVRLVIIGGEKALAHRVAQWHANLGQTARPARLFNGYGPTEATVVATLCELHPGVGNDHVAQSEVPIGRPLGDALAYILDKSLNPVPIGVPGELHVGGSGLARGYINLPELTSERFIPDPFSGAPAARLYKTGDVARWRNDGNIEFLGRTDDQVKIRGFRVEPAEVEAVLGQHAALRGAAVLARTDASGDERLTAYVVPHRRPAPTVSELRGYLKGTLPEYMVPSAFVVLEALPLTSSGKVDRRALPAPDSPGLRAKDAYVQPRTPVEERLAEIWSEVLGVERVGAHDDFFGLGGHSLLATRVVSRVREVFGVEVPLISIFEEPTIAGLAERLEVARQSRSAPHVTAPRLDDVEELRF